MLNDIIFKLEEKRDHCVEFFQKGQIVQKNHAAIYADLCKAEAFFRTLNLTKGDRVSIMCKNCYEWLLVDLVCIHLGVVLMPINPEISFSTEDLFNDMGCRYIFTDNLKKFKADDKIIPIKNVIENNTEYNKLINRSVEYSESDFFTIIHTSGTTDDIKMIPVNVKSFNHLVRETQEMFQFKNSDKFLIFLPLHVYLQRCYFLSSIYFGFNITLIQPLNLFNALKKCKPTIIISVPLFFDNVKTAFLNKVENNFFLNLWYKTFVFLRKRNFANGPFYLFKLAFGGKIRYVLTGSSPSKLSTLQFFEQMGLPLYEGYGMTEMGGMIALNNPFNYRAGSVGKPFPGKKVSLDNEGQIIVSSDYHACDSYLFKTDKQNVFLKEGAIATGDLGYFDKDGFLFIGGRIKDLIILSGGEKVNPQSIENKFKAHSEIEEIVVIGDDKPYLGAIIISKQQNVSLIIDTINNTLSNTEKIYKYYVSNASLNLEDGTLNSNLKINRRKVIEIYANQINDFYDE